MGELDYIAKGDKLVNDCYRFVSHDQVSAKVHPLLVKHGVNIYPSVLEMKQDENRTTVELRLWIQNVDNAEDAISCVFAGYGIDKGDKGPGKAISYAYKYALLKLFCLETGDDPDFDAQAAYEPAECTEFASIIPEGMNVKETKLLNEFLEHSADVMKKHVEDVKREAVKRPKDFLKKFHEWKQKK